MHAFVARTSLHAVFSHLPASPPYTSSRAYLPHRQLESHNLQPISALPSALPASLTLRARDVGRAHPPPPAPDAVRVLPGTTPNACTLYPAYPGACISKHRSTKLAFPPGSSFRTTTDISRPVLRQRKRWDG
ncbi:hypothetical protein K525DRAFT_275197 [Schizophyllum commune Loenen D]|nr:hypothetical protein K525DRAFT_275197 [Schizophyllum commune Loenen D]